MITESSIEIDADPATVWDVYAAVERWPDWTASVTRLTALDGTAIEVGRRYRIEQPKMPKLVWTVTAVEPGRSWTWEQRSPGGTTVASHEVVGVDGGRTLVRQHLDQRGPIGALVGRAMKRLTVRYLEMESQGLKAASEARRAAEA